MTNKSLLRFTIPSMVIGMAFFAVCLISIRYIHTLQTNLADVLAENVTSLQAAQELVIRVRQLRFHSFLYLLDPKTERLVPVQEDQVSFEIALDIVRRVAKGPEEQTQIKEIVAAYKNYKEAQDRLRDEAQAHLRDRQRDQALSEAYKAADNHEVRQVVKPCEDLVEFQRGKMEEIAAESQRVSQDAFIAMVLLGLAGPVGGMVVGFGITRGLRKTVHRLSVRVQDMAQHLDRDVGSVSLVADGDFATLEKQMQFIVGRVETAARQLQQQQRELIRTEQLSQVGQLAAGVAHEIRNPLTGIKMLVEASLRPQQPRSLREDDLRLMLREIKRLEITVQSFLDFARLPTPRMEPCDLRDLIHQAWEAVRMRAGIQRVELAVHVPDQGVIARVDAGQLTTVLVNLFLNALDVVSPGGTIEVRLQRKSNDMVSLSVLDSGPGIPGAILDRLFQPFATNKPHGTGLGLYLSARILEEHGGTISAANRPEGGACFTVKLPAPVPGEIHENVAGH
jgi:two-component system sensor histidine kinase HydH